MQSANRPWWQQITALVSVSVGGAVTGLSFVPKAAADFTSPAGLPIRLLALERAAQPARQAQESDAMLRSAIVNVARYYLRMAAGKTPAEMEAIIWRRDSVNGADHGQSCAAFASLTLELAAQAVGQRSWVTGGTSYPWPLHKWADARVEPNADSPGIVSILQDAQAHGRWHRLGSRYHPRPGDWVLFEGHVEVVTGYTHGVLHTVGGDSLPNFSVNAHEYRAPLSGAGVLGFVNNGTLAAGAPRQASGPGDQTQATQSGDAALVPGLEAALSGGQPRQPAAPGQTQTRYQRYHPSLPARAVQETGAQHAFISQIAPGAIAAQRRYGVPASVTIAQAIDESGWGRSMLASKDHNLFGIKGTGPAGNDPLPTQEYVNGRYVNTTASFRVYHDTAQSISDHGKLLATSGYYQQAMAHRNDPNAFATALTGVYATDPTYGSQLIDLMQRYDLYRYDSPAAAPQAAQHQASPPAGAGPAPTTAPPASSAIPGLAAAGSPAPASAGPAPASAPRQHRHRNSGFAAGPADAAQPAIPGIDAGPVTAQKQPTAAAATGPGGTSIPGVPPGQAGSARAAGPATAGGGISASTTAAVAAGGTGATGTTTAPLGTGGSGAAGTNTAADGTRTARARRAAAPDPGVPGRARRAAPRAEKPASRPAANRATGPASRPARASTRRYQPQIPPSVRTAFTALARVPLLHEEPLYRDVASGTGLRWELLAACDWMQCRAQPRHSPVHGEKLGTLNPDGTAYRTRSEALAQCADDLAQLAHAVYGVDITAQRCLSVRELASVYAAFRWGRLLKLHRTSAMEFPYSVAGLTAQHLNMRWPNIDEPHAPDKPGARFRMPFGAVPIVLCLSYPATV